MRETPRGSLSLHIPSHPPRLNSCLSELPLRPVPPARSDAGDHDRLPVHTQLHPAGMSALEFVSTGFKHASASQSGVQGRPGLLKRFQGSSLTLSWNFTNFIYNFFEPFFVLYHSFPEISITFTKIHATAPNFVLQSQNKYLRICFKILSNGLWSNLCRFRGPIESFITA